MKTCNDLKKMAQPKFVAVIFCILPLTLRSQQATLWQAPPEARRTKNPLPTAGEGLSAIAPLNERNCLRCHGAGGAANGPEAHALPEPANLADAKALKVLRMANYSGKSAPAAAQWIRWHNFPRQSGGKP